MRSVLRGKTGQHDWRANAFRHTSRVLLMVALPAAMLAFAFAGLEDPRAFRVVMLCLVGVIVGVAILAENTARYRYLAVALVGALMALCLTSLAKYGLLPGTALGLSAAIVLAGVFLGSRAVWITTTGGTLLILAIGAGVQAGLIHPVRSAAGSMSTGMAAWIRFAAVYFTTTAFVSATVSTLIARLERSLTAEREARAAADEARRLREEFIAVAAHELRTPATSLLLALQTLSHRTHRAVAGVEIGVRMLDIAERQASRINGLVEALLDASKLEQGPLPLVLSEVDLADTARRAVATLGEPLRVSGSTITLDLGHRVVGRWDRSRVEQVVTNLVSNAIKYGEGKEIVIRAAAVGDDAQLVVQDHGMGIASEARGRVFGRFERAVSVRNFGGFGLGLYVVQRIVDSLEGRVECESEPHQGSTFTVILPRKGPRANESERSEAVTVGSGERRTPWPKPT